MIQIVGPRLSQWDTGRIISVSGSNASHAHIANRGDSHAPIMDIVDGEVKIPDYLMQTGKDLCVYLVLDGITQESKTFSVQKREKPENYVYEDDRRNYIYELITDAQTATEAANQAAQTASNAAQTATNAATTADTAAKSAMEAAGKVDQAVNTANIAAKNANEAAAKAENTAKALMVVGGAGGANISLDNAIDQFLVGLRICGKTTQNGTPTPTTPVDLVSVGTSGSITVNITGKSDSQSMTLATPNGLPGIPVPSGGNYTDANGQQWICDEIDFARGVYAQNIGRILFDGSSDEGWGMSESSNFYQFYTAPVQDARKESTILCSAFQSKNLFSGESNSFIGTTGRISFFTSMFKTLDSWKSYLSGNRLTVFYGLSATKIVHLTEEELAAYAALRTYRGNTTVTNDAGAHMELEYVMDAKKYIDSKISAGILAATVE